MKIALSFSASIDAGVVVVVCSVMSKRHDGAGIIYFEGRGVVLSFWGPRLREFVTARTSYGRTRGAPRQTLTRTTAETEIDDFCLDRPPRARSERASSVISFFAFPPLKAFEWTTLRGLNWKKKEGKSNSLRDECDDKEVTFRFAENASQHESPRPSSSLVNHHRRQRERHVSVLTEITIGG